MRVRGGLLAFGLVLLGLPVMSAEAGAAVASGPQLQVQTGKAGDGTMGPAAARAARGERLDADPAATARAKASAGGQSRKVAGPTRALAPVTSRNWTGLNTLNVAPSDSTGAVGTTRYIELVNNRFGIYNRTANAPLSNGTLNSLFGAATTDNVFDPQVIWDPTNSRFFAVADQVVSATDNRLAYAFSKTASPTTAADWCKYFLGYGADFPDYPKLGDTTNFALIGVNVFTGNTFTGSDGIGLSKPAAGAITTCPTAASIIVGISRDLKNADGSAAFTPVPANQTDGSTTGYMIARPAALPAAFLTLFRVTRNANGTPNIQVTGANVVVPSYSVPPNAPQGGVSQLLDTSDTRNTQAVSATDPRFSAVGLWTQHTVAGGAGAMVRWYEINPVTRGLLQTGTVTNASRFVFNGAVSPDRRAQGAARAYGSNMVLNFNTSSSTAFPDIEAVAKLGAGAQSAAVVLKTSTASVADFTCTTAGSVCRWGDYAAATPDPASATGGTAGQVWGTNAWAQASAGTNADWRTQNFAAKP